ncbi:Hypothetical predicted protein [Octopus vulgaris]|uniref:Uncharacterized protein n=1 Tax=Octopus vulgaris TaxID=6645 RepID=A0AA36AHP7_OCTVU|nr:Hypothetical predicted protein [Octopus vulgaris]
MVKEALIICWKKVWPECVQDYKGFSLEDIQHEAVNNAVKLTKVLCGKGFDNITQDEVNNLIDAHSETLTNKDLLELMKSASKEEEEVPNPEEEEDEVCLAIKRLSGLLRTAKELQGKAEAWDPYVVQSFQFDNVIDAAMQTYETLLITMKKRQQLLITMFLKPTKKALHKDTTFPKTPEEEASPEEP